MKAKLRKWGSSYGLIVPMKLVKEKNLQEGEELDFNVNTRNPIREVFGMLKDWKTDTQTLKDEIKKGWD